MHHPLLVRAVPDRGGQVQCEGGDSQLRGHVLDAGTVAAAVASAPSSAAAAAATSAVAATTTPAATAA